LLRSGTKEKVGVQGGFKMLATILVLVILLEFGQLELLYWRRKIAKISTHPISDRVRAAAGIGGQSIEPHDFRSILSLHALAPGLHGPAGDFRGVNSYYQVLEKLGRLIPASAEWANAEMTICSKYAAVIVDQHLERNITRAAEPQGLTTGSSNTQNAAILSS
jgi:hypothetical protein